MNQVFDSIADSYDRWYDSPGGRAIFEAEVACLRSLIGEVRGRWLEVGVGTGRFAEALGISEGLDPAPHMLEIAARRGIKVHSGVAENLPFAEDSFDGMLLALALCFVADAHEALMECRRVLRPGGRLALGVVPAESAWGRAYIEKAAKGHPVYSGARFRTTEEVVTLVEGVGFRLVESASALFWNPGDPPPPESRVEKGMSAGAGFVGMLFEKT
jgi:ubiquinone/menaquinone biosynthesis C-methylase UbiE